MEEFLESTGMSKNWVAPEAIPNALKLMYQRDKHATHSEYTEEIDKFAHHWASERSTKKAWLGITGSWRTIDQVVVDDVAELVTETVDRGYGIVTGGALGVDYVATEVVRGIGNPSTDLRIVLPIDAVDYMTHYGHTADAGPESKIHTSQGSRLGRQLYELSIDHPDSIYAVDIFDGERFMEPDEQDFRIHAYYFRNGLIAHGADGLGVFQVNGSKGVADTVMKAQLACKPIRYGGLNGNGYTIAANSSGVIQDYDTMAIPGVTIEPAIRRNSEILRHSTSRQSN